MRMVKDKLMFFRSARRRLKNSLLFLNIVKKQPYTNKDIEFAEKTKFNIQYKDIDKIQAIMPDILKLSEIVPLSSDQAKSFKYNPKKVSHDFLGTTDYWWIILMLNGFHDILDFKDFTFIRIPKSIEFEKYMNDYLKTK